MTNILCLADLHYPQRTEIQKICSLPSIDMVFWLGDIDEFTLEEIRHYYSNAFHVGVLGNHDINLNLEYYGIFNTDKKYIKRNEISIVGLEDSICYKDIYGEQGYPSYTQGQSLLYSETLPKADIILSHTSPYGIHETNDYSHKGLFGIRNYIDKHCPKYSIHGHQHIDKKTILENGTIVIGIYGASVLEFETGKIEKII